MAEVTMENVTKIYGEDVVAVRDMNLDIPDGEFVVFVGPSGCGKSTALRMVAGLEDISRGKLFIGDELVNDVAPRERDVAMVFQNYALYPHMNVRENMAFALKLRKMDSQEITRRVEDAARILGLENFLDRKPRALSGGQRQRVALGGAIVRNPQAFLMDEPLSNLDAKLRVQMRTEIAKLHNRIGTTTIYVTQDRIERDDGSLAAVFGQTRIPIPRELQESAEDLERFVDGDVVLGIRPEHFEDVELAETTEGTTPLDVEPQVIESMGNEKYVYFGLPQGGEAAHTRSIDEMESEIGTGGDQAGGAPVA